MNSITASTLARTILGNRALSILLPLSVWIVAVMSGSAPIIFAAGLLVIARPFLYIALISANEEDQMPGEKTAIRSAGAESTYRGTWADGRNASELNRGRALA